MDEQRCATCKWWTPRQEKLSAWQTDPGADWNECKLARGVGSEPAVQPTLAFAEDAEAYQAILWTRIDFGCVQWKARD